MILTFVFAFAADWNVIGSRIDALAAKRGLVADVRIHDPNPTGVVYTYRRGKRAYLEASLAEAAKAGEVEATRQELRQGNGVVNPETAPSGLPLGEYCFVTEEGGRFQAGGEGLIVSVRLSSAENGDALRMDRRLLESVARVNQGRDKLVCGAGTGRSPRSRSPARRTSGATGPRSTSVDATLSSPSAATSPL